jgi:hypothetical protein
VRYDLPVEDTRKQADSQPPNDAPVDFSGGMLLDDDIPDEGVAGKGGGQSGFAPVKKHFEEAGHAVFDDPVYYKTALSNGGDLVQRLHAVFQKLIQSRDAQDRTLFRAQIIPVFWEYMKALARQSPQSMPGAKRFLLRFAMLHPNLLNVSHRKLFSTIIVNNSTDEPVYYLDEWFAGIGQADINPSSTDETHVVRAHSDAHLRELLAKAQGKLDGSKGFLRAKAQERFENEEYLKSCVEMLTVHAFSSVFDEAQECYSDAQRKLFAELQNTMKTLLRADREMDLMFRDIESARNDLEVISSKMDIAREGKEEAFDAEAAAGEFQTVRQMVKMTIGRQGNAFPVLSGEYFHCQPNGIGTRENVISILSWIESIDQEAFIRTYRKQTGRIVPYVILLPSYGDTGICWEPLEQTNKATSRGRIAVPMYPRNLTVAVLTAVADFRWQAAKEQASYYWMEEGLTGNYYQWIIKQKLKGDVKRYFIQDYIFWMTKESDGIQKLDKEVRGIFWRYMPFSRSVKERLKDRNLVYQELYQRDLNRAASDR